MFKLTRNLLYAYENYPNIQKQYLLNLIEKYNFFLYSELDKTNCDVKKIFIRQDLSNVVDIQNKLNLNEITEEDINKNIKLLSNKYNQMQNKSQIKSN
jgi:hypothetical protein